jgi:hypothetical protein
MRGTEMNSYHIDRFEPGPNERNWPNGGWSLYRITGDEIARRIKFDDKNRKVVRRDSWCGYIGLFEELADVQAAIQADIKRGETAR